ncbi:MAG TPA: hypothetical protein VJT71_11080 [Pyrinomonadaceae bacterium]|nr:hypothetical protein [Pyrinomonadaceae bacterium]
MITVGLFPVNVSHFEATSFSVREPANGKLQAIERLSVNNGRPLAEAIVVLEVRFGRVITYEDPPYVFAGDINDVTESVRRDLDKFEPGRAPRVLVPKGGKFDFVIVQNANGSPAQDRTLQRLVHDYALSAQSARFRLEKSADAFHVVPTLVRNSSGRLTSQIPVLDARITLPAKERTGFQEIRDFCAEVSRVTGKQVVMGTIPSLLAAHKERYGIPNATTARIALARMLKRFEAGRGLSWRLLYDPGMKIFVLNIHSVS